MENRATVQHLIIFLEEMRVSSRRSKKIWDKTHIYLPTNSTLNLFETLQKSGLAQVSTCSPIYAKL